jgi:uncharacterized protein (TIGR03437 family)
MLPFVVRFLLFLSLAATAFAQTPTFGKELSLPAQRATLAITTADFNGDGLQDIAVSNAASGNISVFLGTGGGAFSSAPFANLPSVVCQAAYLTSGNFTGAAGPDLLAVCPLGPVVVLPNTGHGTFGAPISTALPAPAWVGNLLLGSIHAAVGDFNGDGKLDIAIPTFDLNGATGNWFLLLGKGNGSFQPPAALPFSGLLPLSLAAGDFNGDGKLDLITAVADISGSLSLQFAAGQGDGTFLLTTTIPLPSTAGSLILPADLNGDGKLDIVIAGPSLITNLKQVVTSSGSGESGITVFLGDGKGGFKMSFNATEPSYMSGAALAKLRGTGQLDLIETTIQGDFFSGGLPSGAIEIRTGNGDGTFGSPSALSLPPSTVPTDVVAADFNGDGVPDIAFASLPAKGVVLKGFSLSFSLIGFLESVLQQLPNGNADVLLNTTGAPLTFSNTNAASFAAGPLASSSIVSAFGTGLAASIASATSLPLPTLLGDDTVTIKDSSGANLPAPLFYVSPTQINYAIPDAAAPGPATITIKSGASVFTAAQQIVSVAPGIFSANGMAAGYSVRIVSGVQQFTLLIQNGALAPVDVSGGQTFLELFGTGIRNHASAVVVRAGSAHINAAYAGAQGVYLGEDQINIQLPASLQGAGVIDVALEVDGQTSNSVQVRIQ